MDFAIYGYCHPCLDEDESPFSVKELVNEDLNDPDVEKIEQELQRLQRIKKLKEEVLELQRSLKVPKFWKRFLF